MIKVGCEWRRLKKCELTGEFRLTNVLRVWYSIPTFYRLCNKQTNGTRVLLLHFLIEGKANSVTQITKWANQRQAPENVRVQSPAQYSLFQNGRHFSILSFPCKLALMASLSNVKFKKYLTFSEAIRANLHGNKRILKWRPFGIRFIAYVKLYPPAAKNHLI